jgi:actin-related protein
MVSLAGIESSLSDCIGDAAVAKKGGLTVTSPFRRRGAVIVWDELEAVWNHALRTVMDVDPTQHAILCAEMPGTPDRTREQQAELLFESFGVPAMYLANQAMLSLYARGKTTGCALECGDGMTHAVPVFDGYAITHASQRLELAGSDVTEYFLKLLKDKGQPATTDTARAAKEKHCKLSLDYDAAAAACGSEEPASYELPDGSSMTLASEAWQAPEVLFQVC